MILIVTNRDDHTADWLILELIARGAKFVRFNTEDFLTEGSLSWSMPQSPYLELGGKTLDMNEVSSVWYRRPVSPNIPSFLSEDRARWVADEARDALESMWRAHPGWLWVNHPDRNLAASSKPEQLVTARMLGFRVPDSLITNDPDDIREFAKAHPQGIICKPLRNGRLTIDDREKLFFTSVLDEAALEDIRSIDGAVYLFQELIAKRYDVRVTVIGDDAFAVRLLSQEHEDARVDWRRALPGVVAHEIEVLPREVEQRCIALVRHYGLRFGAIDLAVEPDGSHAFFELNPNGQWAWLEQVTGLPLRSRLADLLQQVKAVE